MHVFVTGGSGVLGRALIPTLVSRGHVVDALVRTTDAAELATDLGAHPVPGDLLDAGGVDAISADAVLHFATSIPRPDRDSGSWSVNDRIGTEGTEALLAAASAGSVRRVIGYSVCWVYGDRGDEWITEQTAPPDPAELAPEIRSAAALETMVRAWPREWLLLRSGWLYGPGTGTTEALLRAAAAGELTTNGLGDDYLSPITAGDTAQAALLALERVPSGTVLNVADDEPQRERDLFAELAAHVGGPRPTGGPPRRGLGSLRLSNALARSFGFRPHARNVRAGLAAMKAEFGAGASTKVGGGC